MADASLVALLLLVSGSAALLLASAGKRGEDEGRVVERFRRLLGIGAGQGQREHAAARRRWQWLDRRLLRAGIEPGAVPWPLVGGALGGAVLAGLLVEGPTGGLMGLLVLAAAGLGWLEGLSRRRRRQILEQLPTFLEHVSRAVATGSSLQQALALATAEARDPLRQVFERIDRMVRLGASLAEAFDQSASVYDLRELDMLSLTLRVSIEYGGGVRQTLAGIVTAIRQREQAQRELRAMTGETRLSAWILGALPVGVALYVSAVNPTYLDHLWSDPGGRSILWVSLALQVIGSLLLWRMVRSIA